MTTQAGGSDVYSEDKDRRIQYTAAG
ncbi:hypothetical protein WG8_3888 [Paenibacillus sp. Aloe-11]|nr:hypothetical protein WG8_3888 [Paenibacillus sp. Aloe-11]